MNKPNTPKFNNIDGSTEKAQKYGSSQRTFILTVLVITLMSAVLILFYGFEKKPTGITADYAGYYPENTFFYVDAALTKEKAKQFNELTGFKIKDLSDLLNRTFNADYHKYKSRILNRLASESFGDSFSFGTWIDSINGKKKKRMLFIIPVKREGKATELINEFLKKRGNLVYKGTMGYKVITFRNKKGAFLFRNDKFYMADSKEKIDASAIRGDNAAFISGGSIQELSGAEKKVKKLDPGVYTPPYKKLFRSAMISTDTYFGLITGIAGSYYISIFNASSGSSLVKNIASSSFEFSMKGDYILYVRGGTGVWSVVKYDIPAKKRNELRTLGKITDIYLAEEGFIYISEKRAYVENLSGERWEAPAELDVKGICRNMVLSDYNGKTYIIDFNVLFEKVKEFSQAKDSKKS